MITKTHLRSTAYDAPPADIDPKLVELLEKQRAFFATGKTRDVQFRKTQINKLRRAIVNSESEIFAALKKDLGKPPFEAYATEIGLTLEEIAYTLRNLSVWAEPTPVPTPLTQFLSSAHIYYEPFGNVLIIGAWNYPFQLTVLPLMQAMSAGNCAIVKPSEHAPHTGALVAKIVEQNFDREYVAVVEGGIETNAALLQLHWDHIFFTGSPAVGKIVMKAAAERLTPVTLELGGKSPCIVDKTANIPVAAARIVWGKFVNCGQTCIAPDYLLVDSAVKEPLLKAIAAKIKEFYGPDPKNSPDYGRIVNDRHYRRLKDYLRDAPVYHGGDTDDSSRYISPTLLDETPVDAPVMQEEIFGPILPTVSYQNLDDAIAFVNSRPRPLALYVFTQKSAVEKQVLDRTLSGGGCVNDTLVHLSTPELPFGGIGHSGMGAYHGKFGFETFSHKRSILKKANFPDIKLRYPPYKNRLSLLKKLMG
jgi:aldehyde dehydrogenase (NAD+)